MNQKLILDLSKCTTIIYEKILSNGFYYFKEKEIAEWFMKKYTEDGVNSLGIFEEEISLPQGVIYKMCVIKNK